MLQNKSYGAGRAQSSHLWILHFSSCLGLGLVGIECLPLSVVGLWLAVRGMHAVLLQDAD